MLWALFFTEDCSTEDCSMAPPVHILLRFQVLHRVYQFVAMPFGLATVPLDITYLVIEVRKVTLRFGILMHMYLDNWFIKANSCHEAQSATLTFSRFDLLNGWFFNREKSDLFPKQIFTFLGQVYNLPKGVYDPTEASVLLTEEPIHP